MFFKSLQVYVFETILFINQRLANGLATLFSPKRIHNFLTNDSFQAYFLPYNFTLAFIHYPTKDHIIVPYLACYTLSYTKTFFETFYIGHLFLVI